MRVAPGVDASKVKVTGPGVQGTTPASLPAQFKVDTREAGVADLECVVQVISPVRFFGFYLFIL
jgi:hypothetical protein